MTSHSSLSLLQTQSADQLRAFTVSVKPMWFCHYPRRSIISAAFKLRNCLLILVFYFPIVHYVKSIQQRSKPPFSLSLYSLKRTYMCLLMKIKTVLHLKYKVLALKCLMSQREVVLSITPVYQTQTWECESAGREGH